MRDQLIRALIACPGLIYLLVSSPNSSLETFSRLRVFAVFSVFVFWVLGLLNWGEILSSRLKLDNLKPFPDFTLAFVFAALVSAFIGLIGNIHTSIAEVVPIYQKYIYVLILISGFIINFQDKANAIQHHHMDQSSLKKWSVSSKFIFFFIGISIVLNLFNSGILSSHGDALYYHLLAPSLWSDKGKIFFKPEWPVVFQINYWEYMYIWAFSFFADSNGKGLIESQFFCQFIHGFVGYGGTALALYYFNRCFIKDRKWILLSVLAGICTKDMWLTSSIAKNDWGVSFWVIAGGAFLFSKNSKPNVSYILAGVLLALGCSSKLTTAFLVLAIGITWITKEIIDSNKLKQSDNEFILQKSFLALFGFLLILLPTLLRNWFATGNPVFPTMNGFWGSDSMGPTWHNFLLNYQSQGLKIDLAYWMSRIKQSLSLSPFAFSYLLLPFLYLFKLKLNHEIYYIGLITVLSFFLWILGSGPWAELRLAGPILILISSTGVLLISDLLLSLNSWALSKKKSSSLIKLTDEKVVFALVALLILATSRIPFHAPKHFFKKPRADQRLIQMTGGEGKNWLLNHAKKEDKIVSTGDNEIYYLSKLDISVLILDPALDRPLYGEKDPLIILRHLRNYQAKYLLDTTHYDDIPWRGAATVIYEILNTHPEAIVFQGQRSRVVDMEILESVVKF